jgi:CHAT domain-containing protein
MHGILNKKLPQNSALAFTEQKDSSQDAFLYAYEISQLPIRADLIVLSACETGYGKFQQGEGVLSLGRSFFYAGAPSLVMSLWSINDQATQQIMQAFYQGLELGQSQTQALRQAKLHYLQHTQAQVEAAHPAFWAALQQVGADRPVALHRKALSGWWGLALLPLLGLIWFWRYRRS